MNEFSALLSQGLPWFANTAVHYLLILLQAVLILIAGWWISRILYNRIARALTRSRHVDATLRPLVGSLVLWSVRAIAVIAVLACFGVQTASIIAVLGAAGLAVGLALQNTLQNIAAGTMLLVLRPFKVGDYIAAGSTVAGTVEEIGLFTTTLTTFDGIYMSVPNNQIWGTAVTNYSRNPSRRIDVAVSIARDDDVDAANQALDALMKSHSMVLANPAPQVMVKEVNDQAVVLNVRMWSANSDYWTVYWDMQRGVKEAVERAGCTLPYPTRTILMPPAATEKAPS